MKTGILAGLIFMAMIALASTACLGVSPELKKIGIRTGEGIFLKELYYQPPYNVERNSILNIQVGDFDKELGDEIVISSCYGGIILDAETKREKARFTPVGTGPGLVSIDEKGEILTYNEGGGFDDVGIYNGAGKPVFLKKAKEVGRKQVFHLKLTARYNSDSAQKLDIYYSDEDTGVTKYAIDGTEIWNYNIEVSEKLDKLPAKLVFPPDLQKRIKYDSEKKLLIFKGVMRRDKRDILLALSQEEEYKKAVEGLFRPVPEIYTVDIFKRHEATPLIMSRLSGNKTQCILFLNDDGREEKCLEPNFDFHRIETVNWPDESHQNIFLMSYHGFIVMDYDGKRLFEYDGGKSVMDYMSVNVVSARLDKNEAPYLAVYIKHHHKVDRSTLLVFSPDKKLVYQEVFLMSRGLNRIKNKDGSESLLVSDGANKIWKYSKRIPTH